MVRAPKHGYGKNMNPCIDCRIMMFRHAKGIMKEANASFVFTGEVLGQRPMSQRKEAMNIIDRESGLKGLVLRPLSARLLEPTIPENEGIVNRERLLEIRGRSRKSQIRMAEEYNINDYHCPAGGCLLTQTDFANRIRDMIKFSETISVKDTRMLRIGRHFRLTKNCKVIVGRDKEENAKLERMAGPDDHSFYVEGYKGPIVIAIANGAMDEGLIPLVSQITARYSDAPKDIEVPVCWRSISNNDVSTILARPIDETRLKEMRI
jgi:tRNA U34 2-thiouridine synthase MnmA/TrmU